MTKPKVQTEKPSVVIVGPGRLGLALALALRSSGYPLLAFVSRRAEHARKAARIFGPTQKPVQTISLNQAAKSPLSDLIIIATPDDTIEEVARRLAGGADPASGRRSGRTVLHTSGALSSEVLAPLVEVGFHTGSLHPLVSVSEPRAGAEALRGAFFCLEGDKQALKLAGRIVRDLDGNSFSISAENKALYHAAAVMSSGHVVALFDLATEMLVASGLDKATARRILVSLLASAIRNLEDSDAAASLTGTFSRGDVATVQRHLQALSNKNLPEALVVYRLLGLRSLDLAEKGRVEPQALQQIRKLLKSPRGRKK
jgi:predicted short-subunit dehydrogenase-like oxidoreductase (DUF2520 family)